MIVIPSGTATYLAVNHTRVIIGQARLTDDILWFLCDPGTLIGISSVDLGYTADEARCRDTLTFMSIITDGDLSCSCPPWAVKV